MFCSECGKEKWLVKDAGNYSFIFTCASCGLSKEIISLVDLQILCERKDPPDNLDLCNVKPKDRFLSF